MFVYHEISFFFEIGFNGLGHAISVEEEEEISLNKA